MFRQTICRLKMSPIMVLMQELSSQGKLKGVRHVGRFVSEQYKKMTPANRSALNRRAAMRVNRGQKVYNTFVRKTMPSLSGTSAQKQRQLSKLWAAEKAKMKKPAKGKKVSASKKVKKVAKRTKKSKKN